MNAKDEIVAEVRAARDAYAARFHYDLREICADLRAKEQASPGRLARLEPVQPSLPVQNSTGEGSLAIEVAK